MQFEMTINMDGRGFSEGSKRQSLKLIVARVAEDMRGQDFGDVKDWYGDKVGEWRLTGPQ